MRDNVDWLSKVLVNKCWFGNGFNQAGMKNVAVAMVYSALKSIEKGSQVVSVDSVMNEAKNNLYHVEAYQQ